MKRLILTCISVMLLAAMSASIASADSHRALVFRLPAEESGWGFVIFGEDGWLYSIPTGVFIVDTQSRGDHLTVRIQADFPPGSQMEGCNWDTGECGTFTVASNQMICDSDWWDWIYEGFTDSICRGNGAIVYDERQIGEYYWYDRLVENWHLTISQSGHYTLILQVNDP